MSKELKQIIQEELSALLVEINIDVQDEKKRGYEDHLGKMFYDSLKSLKPIKITGRLGLKGGGRDDSSQFKITLYNGDEITAIRNVSPAYAIIFVNGDKIKDINSSELLSNKLPDLIRNYYNSHEKSKTIS